MKQAAVPFCATLLVSLGSLTSLARAEFVEWSYQWSNSPLVLHADAPGKGEIVLTNGGLLHDPPRIWPVGHSANTASPTSLQQAKGPAELVATYLMPLSEASGKHPDRFTHSAYHLALLIVDGASHKSGWVTFDGFLTGWLSDDHAHIRNHLTSARRETIHLGDHLYTVNFDNFTPPGSSDRRKSGSIDVHVQVRHNPEPSSLALASLGLPLFGGIWWWHRRRERRESDVGTSYSARSARRQIP